jgi:hypothetical protein
VAAASGSDDLVVVGLDVERGVFGGRFVAVAAGVIRGLTHGGTLPAEPMRWVSRAPACNRE